MTAGSVFLVGFLLILWYHISRWLVRVVVLIGLAGAIGKGAKSWLTKTGTTFTGKEK